MRDSIHLEGRDNQGRPRKGYAIHLSTMDDISFVKEAERKIWLSAYASNNHRSDYHWQADACYDEAQRREKPELYRRAYKYAAAGAGVSA